MSLWHSIGRSIALGSRAGTSANSGNIPPLTVALPGEVLLVIAEKLCLADRLSLMVANKALYGLLRSWKLPKPDRLYKEIGRIDFLSRLESDNPHLTFCFNCRKLHPVAKEWLLDGCALDWCVSASCGAPRMFLDPREWCLWAYRSCFTLKIYEGMSFEYGREIMKRVAWGGRFGVPIESLFEEDEEKTLDHMLKATAMVRAKATRVLQYNEDPRLMGPVRYPLVIRITYKFTHPTGCPIRLRKAIDRRYIILPNCAHVELGVAGDRKFRDEVDNVSYFSAFDMDFTEIWPNGEYGCIPTLKSGYSWKTACRICNSQVHVSADMDEEKKWFLEVETFHMLGEFDHPGEAMWQRNTMHEYSSKNKGPDFDEDASYRRLWEEEDKGHWCVDEDLGRGEWEFDPPTKEARERAGLSYM